MKRLLTLTLGAGLALLGPMATAAWTTTGTGVGLAGATTVNQANAPTATRGAGKVTLAWAASSLANGAPVGGYRVLRHAGATTTVACATSAPVLVCDDNSPIGTQVSYGVVATVGAAWSGPESALTAFTYDNVAPVTTASISPAPNGAGWNRSAVTVTLTATDASSGVDHVTYSVDGGAPTNVNGTSTSFLVSGAGTHAVTYFAVDRAGNTEVLRSTSVRIDPTAPVTAASAAPAPNAAGWNKTDVALTFSASDGTGSGVAGVTVGGVTTSGSTAARSVTAEGTTTLAYFATDIADNVEGAKSVTVRIDKTAPTYSISPVTSTLWKQVASQAVTITGADALSGLASIAYTVDGVAQSPSATSPVSFSLGAGDHTVAFTVTDLAGNTAGGSAQVRVDGVAPTATLSQAAGNGPVTVSASDATSGVATIYYRDGATGPFTSTTSNPVTLALGSGSHTIYYYAVDNAGNQGAVQSQTLTVDATAPVVTPNQPASRTNNNTGGTSWEKNCSNLPQICATATDTGGSGVVAASVNFTLTGTSGTNTGKCWNGTAFVTGTTCSVTAAFNATTGAVTSPVPQSAMLDGTYSLVVRARDVAGNNGVGSTTFTIT